MDPSYRIPDPTVSRIPYPTGSRIPNPESRGKMSIVDSSPVGYRQKKRLRLRKEPQLFKQALTP